MTARPAVLWFMGLQRVVHDLETEEQHRQLMYMSLICLVYYKCSIGWLEFIDNVKECIFVLLLCGFFFFSILVFCAISKSTLYQSQSLDLTSSHNTTKPVLGYSTRRMNIYIKLETGEH